MEKYPITKQYTMNIKLIAREYSTGNELLIYKAKYIIRREAHGSITLLSEYEKLKYLFENGNGGYKYIWVKK